MRDQTIENVSHAAPWSQWLVRLLVSALAIAAVAATGFSASNSLPFRTACGGDSCRVTSVLASAASPTLHTGDEIVVSDQPFATRAVLLADNVPTGRDYLLYVRRDTEHLSVSVHTLPSSRTQPTGSRIASRTALVFILLFGLLMLWRGESAASRGLCLFTLSSVVTAGLYQWALAPPWNLVVQGVGTLIGGPGAFMGLYLTAEALGRADSRSRAARWARTAYLGALLLLYLTEVVPKLIVAAGRPVPLFTAGQLATLILGVVAWIVPLSYLLKGYRVSTPENRLRIRWFIVSIALLLPLLACNLLLQSEDVHVASWVALLAVTQILLTFAVFGILSYAALSQRLVAVRFVLNRALVFGVLTALLIGTLSLLESLIERSVISKEAGLALDIVVPLLLGISIHHIHRWGEENVERVVFRNEYRARSAISTFLRDAGFIAHPVTLFERTVETFAAHGGGRYCALYLSGKDGYERVGASEHARGLPQRISVDDVAMVRLRATLSPVDLFGLSSELGPNGLALPLAIRGRLDGVLVCGEKTAGRYAQAEIEFLSKAAAGIASCIIALRAELRGHFVDRVASGTLPMAQVLEEARGLAEP